MKSIEELEEELKAAAKKCDLVDARKMRNVGNCPSDLQAYDETWREYKRIHHQLTQARKANQELLKALKLALGVLEYIHEGANNQGPHTGISWRCVSNKAEPSITAIRAAITKGEQA